MKIIIETGVWGWFNVFMDILVDSLMCRFGEQVLFADLSFRIASGRKVCIAGPSGSGKTTLLLALMGLAVPAHGQIRIGDADLTPQSAWHLRRNIAYVPQEPDLGDGTVLDRIRQPFAYHANAHLQFDRAAVLDHCRRFRLAESILAKETAQLSGGEKQRIALIIALLLQRPILILDEPVSAVDKDIKRIITDELRRDPARTVVFVSHETVLTELADETIALTPAGGTA